MQLYLAIPLTAAMGLATLAGLCLLMGTELRANRSSAGMLLLGAWWAACEVFWNAAPDAATALFFHRLAAPGFLFIGPLAMLLVVDVAEAPPVRIRGALPAAWAVCGTSLMLTWTTPWMLSSMQRVGWGWGAVPGPAFAAWAAATAVAIGLAVGQWVRDYRGSSTEINRRHGPRVTRFLLPAALVGFATDAVLPIFGVQVPRVGSLSLALAGAVIFWGATRYGFSRLHPQAFSTRILHTLPDGIALTTLHGRIRVANDKLGELLGCTADEAVGRQIGDHLDRVLLDPPREQREVEAQLRPISGPPLPVCVSTAPVDDADGAASGVVLAIQDLREVAALRHRLIVSGRLAAVGELAAGIAHELNNPLAFVRSNLSLLRRDWEKLARALAPDQPQLPPGIDDLEALLDESLEGVDRVATIVRDIREFSHAGGSERELADLNAILDQVLRVASAQLDPNVRVEADYRDAGLVYCEPQRMKQVFLNLVVNAGQAIQGAGRIRVATRGEDEQHLHIVVEDDGCGVPPAVRERIFDPFFTTKPVGRGTGLGLSIAYEIVRSHGGEIWVESEPGRGSAFHVRLPRGGDAEAGHAAVGDTRRRW